MNEQGFSYRPTLDGTEIRLSHDGRCIPVAAWGLEARAPEMPGVDLVQRLLAEGRAEEFEDFARLMHSAVAGLSKRKAEMLGMPPAASLMAVIEGYGLLTNPDFRVTLQWQRLTGQPVVSPQRIGAWLRVGESWQRLPSALFDIAEAAAAVEVAAPADPAAKLRAIASLRAALPAAESQGAASARGLLGRMTILQADSFSLDLLGRGDDLKLVPILHGRTDEERTLLLDPEQQRAFGEGQFQRFSDARPVYTLGNGLFVVLEQNLQRAMGEVRRICAAPARTKRAFFSSPRSFLREALGDDVDDMVVESLFEETAAWSDRVIGLGLWEKRVIPWIPIVGTDWFSNDDAGTGSAKQPSQIGISVDGAFIPLTPEQAREIGARVDDAMAAGRAAVEIDTDRGKIPVPANLATLQALHAVELSALHRSTAKEAGPPDAEALIIRPNEAELEIGADVVRRRCPPLDKPASLATQPKSHQSEGLGWLQSAWAKGLPGVLLADDMGLGKTLQSLAFLAWLREGMAAGTIEKAPILIVAPTGLLENWLAEHERHLAPPRLGTCMKAYGKHLASVRTGGLDDRPRIDVARIGAADWVLTTYETLRDYDRDFGQVRFAALLFDEAQKIKTPGVRLTDAAKAMNAEFKIALTGTPVENRLADLWCITDTVHPGCLQDLKSFSARFEREPDIEKLKELKAMMVLGRDGRPPLMLRRLKEERLPDLPARIENVHMNTMTGQQREAYDQTIQNARDAQRRGAVLEALQSLRRICLHPEPDSSEDDAAFIAASARLKTAFSILDDVARKSEKALVFVDDLEVQARLVGLIQRRYSLAQAPLTINGNVDGRSRQARVDRFQSVTDQFDVMLLSPRAGGVGLTITSANHVIHLSRWWNPAVEDQCTGRAHRIGQTKPVHVHIPMATLTDERRSFDENLHALLERKRTLMREALMPPSATDTERDLLLAETIGA